MYRVLAIIGGGLLLTACSSASFDVFRSEPSVETVQLESEPAGAEAKTSTGQTCRTPCSVNAPSDAAFTVTFALPGFQTETEQVEPIAMGDGTRRLRPNPVTVEMAQAPPSPNRKPPARKKPAGKPKPKTAAAPAASPAQAQAPAAATPGPSASSPWPTQPAAR